MTGSALDFVSWVPRKARTMDGPNKNGTIKTSSDQFPFPKSPDPTSKHIRASIPAKPKPSPSPTDQTFEAFQTESRNTSFDIIRHSEFVIQSSTFDI
jgi:hypothetical protein